MYHLVRFLAKRFEVDLVAPALDGADDARRLLGEMCASIEFVSCAHRSALRRHIRLGPYERDPALAQAIRRRLAVSRYSALQVEKPAMLPYLPAGLKTPVVLDTFAYGLAGAVRALRAERGPLVRARNLIRLLRYAAFDAFCWPPIYALLVVSEVDRQRSLRGRAAGRTLLIPNGVDCQAIRPVAVPSATPPMLLFTGDLGFDPNVEAARILARQILPQVRASCPDVRLHLVGRYPDARVLALQGPGITVAANVPIMLPHLQAATVYVAPLFTGAGTRTKLLEAMAAGLAIVTTPVGIEGIDALPDRDVILAATPAEIVGAVSTLLRDPITRARLGASARHLAESRYDWDSCLSPLEPLYTELHVSRVAG